MTNPNLTRYFVNKAAMALREIWIRCDKGFQHGAIELEAAGIQEAYESLGKALDALGVRRLKPEHCKHPQELREYLNSSADRCNACGRINAMVATRSGAARKWLPAEDSSKIEFGKFVTESLLEGARERIRAGGTP